MTLGHQQEELATGPQVAMTTLTGPETYLTGEKRTIEKLTSPHSPTLTTHLEELPTEEILEVVEEEEQEGEEQEQLEKAPAPGSTSRRSGGDVRSLLHFMSVAGGDIKAALDKSAPCKRSVDHRKYLQKQLCRLTAVVTTHTPTPPAAATPYPYPSSSSSGNHYQVLHPHPHMHPQQHHHCPGATSEEASSCSSPPPPTTPPQQPPTHWSPAPPVVATQQAPCSPSSSTAVPRAARGTGAAQSSWEQLMGRSSSGGALEDRGSGTVSGRRQAPHDEDDDVSSSRRCCDHSPSSPPPHLSPCSTPPQVSNNNSSQQSPHLPQISRQSPGLEQQYLDEEHSQSNSPVPVSCSGDSHEQLPVLNLHVYGAVPPALREQATSNQGLTCNELLILDVTGTGEESSSLDLEDNNTELLLQAGGNLPPLEIKDPSVPCAWSRASSPAPDYRCMASPPAPLSPPLPLPPASVPGSSSNRTSSPVPLPPSSPSSSSRAVPTMVVAATPVPETTDAPHKIRRDVSPTTVVKSPTTREGGGGFTLPPEVTEDRDPLFEVPGVIDPSRAARDADGKDVSTAGTGPHQRASIPLRQRQLPASFWKEPRPEERRPARPGNLMEAGGSTAADLLQAHGAFFVPYCSNPGGALQGAKSHSAYDNYKAMAELYGARYQEAAAAAHRSAGTGPGGGGLSHPDYLLSAYGSKVAGVPGVTNDPTALSVVATAAAYHAGGMYPWPYSMLTGEAEKALAARLQGSTVHPGVQPHLHQHHHNQQHPHLQAQQQQQVGVPQPHHMSLLSTPSSSVAAAAHPMVHGHALLYHRQSAAAAAAAAALTSHSHSSCTSTAVTSTASSRVVGSPPGRSHLHGPGSSPPQAVWDPLAALTAQSLLRQQSHSALWRPIPTKTMSSYQSRFHPFADVH